MYRTAVATLVFVSLVCLGAFSNVYAQGSPLQTCPDIRGTYDFEATYIQVLYTTPPKIKASKYTPGNIQGQGWTGYEESGVPTYVKKKGTFTIYQGSAPAGTTDTGLSCLFHAKRVHDYTERFGFNAKEGAYLATPYEDWYTGAIHGGTKITMRVIANEATPAARYSGDIVAVDNQILYVNESDLPSAVAGGYLGAFTGKGRLFNRVAPLE
jgi:hypothetical protein